MPTTYRFFLAALAALSVSACDTIPVLNDRGQDRDDTSARQSTVEAIPLENLNLGTGLEPGAERQDPARAIREDLRRALDSLPPYRQSAYLDAAEKLVHTGRLEEAEALLDQTMVTDMTPVQDVRKRLLEAEIELRRGDLDRALRDVNRTLRTSNIDPAYISRGLDLKGRIELLKNHPLEAAKAWIRRDSYLVDTRTIGDNNTRIWFALGHLNELALQAAGQDGTDNTLRGWIDLAILFLEFGGDSRGLRTAVTQWTDANRGHPAADFAAVALGPERAPGIRQIALLLPMSSNFGAAARSVYNGFEAAQQHDSDPRRPQLLFYDIGGEPALAGNYVGVAASEGADVIVGPLGKAAVNALLESRQPPKPMVMLGSAPADRALPPGAYQFDLAPEPEAKQVAEFMYVSGHRRVAALYPNDEWGQRVFNAFAEHWRTLGGTLAEARPFQPNADDHTAVLKNLFNLTESETRKSLIESASGLNLDFYPRRRQDVEAIFIAARPDEARLLKPQINFFQGLDLPVYSTSHVYTGRPDAVKDTDLDGIVFPAMPWVLRNTARMKSFKGTLVDAGHSGVSSELFAFGYDAYQLALLAPATGTTGTVTISGLTADLIAGNNGRVQRRLEWAKFQDGVPVRIWEY